MSSALGTRSVARVAREELIRIIDQLDDGGKHELLLLAQRASTAPLK